MYLPGPLRVTSDLSRAVKRWGPSRRQGVCSHPAHLWASFDFVPQLEAPGILSAARVM